MKQTELTFNQEQIQMIAGVDEAGRGPLVGNVVAAAVILDPSKPIVGLADSKKLSEAKRERLFEIICRDALCYAIASANVEEIDRLNILHASMLAMERAVRALSIPPQLALIDGNRCPKDLPCASKAIVRGDATEPAISAASILAKVTRDQQMRELDRQFPQYGFAAHKGYPTEAHLKALQTHGVLSEHRRSFGPVRAQIERKSSTLTTA